MAQDKIIARAVFKGSDGSCGYNLGKEYILEIVHSRNRNIQISLFGNIGGHCDYSSLITFLKNWDNIREENNFKHMDKKIIAGCIAIAKFKGQDVENETVSFHHATGVSTHFHISEFPYHESWHLLMPVVEQIMKIAKVEISNNAYCKICKIYNAKYNMPAVEGKELITVVYLAVVDFVMWHNDNSTK